MLKSSRLPVVMALAVAGAATMAAAPTGGSRSRWQVDVGPSVWLNAKIQYLAIPAADPSLARGDRFYDDGFNRVDASGNVGDGAGGALPSRTGFFGFSSDSQVDLRGGTLALHRLQAASGAYLASQRPDVRPGVDLNARYSLAPATATRDWGITAGLGWARLKESTSGPAATNLRLLTDTYPLGGVVPQRAPYAGRFSPLPGDQRIGDTPTRAISTVPGTVTGTHSFRATTVVARLGAWIELLPVSAQAPRSEIDRWSVLAHAGPALISSRASLGIDEQLQSSASGAVVRTSASGSRNRTDLGGFAGLKLRRACSESLALVAWADYLRGARLTVKDNERAARLDLSRSFVLGAALELQWGKR